MDNPNDKPVCLVTGGSSGIGLQTAGLFASRGYDVSICGRDEQKLLDAKNWISGKVGPGAELHCLTVQADLQDATAAQSVTSATVGAFGRIDVLVNNAAAAPLAPFDEITAEQFEATINTNNRSTFYLTQSAWRLMKEQGRGGAIVNVSSMAAIDPFPGFSLYGSCKAWLELMTHALAAEGKDHNVRVYTIRPGAVETPLLRSLFPDFPAEQTVGPDQVAQWIWRVATDQQGFESGAAVEVTNQRK